MGFDLTLVTKDEVSINDNDSSKFHYLLDRGFCTFIMNGKNHPEPVITELEKVLNIDLSFLLEPDYFDPKSIPVETLRESGMSDNEIAKMQSEESGFVSVDSFLDGLSDVHHSLKLNPNFETDMNYDRKWWNSYFAGNFQKDIETLTEFLQNLKTKGQYEFSFNFD